MDLGPSPFSSPCRRGSRFFQLRLRNGPGLRQIKLTGRFILLLGRPTAGTVHLSNEGELMPRITPAVRTERRQAIIEAAWRCAARKGFADLTVDEVCAAAGVSKGAFYGYFDSKQALLLALLEEDAAFLDAIMEHLDAAPVSNVERLRRFTRAMLERGEHPARVQVRADLWAAMLTERAVRQRFSASVRRRREVLRGWIGAANTAGELVDIPANAFAAILLALGDGLILHAGLDPAGFRWPNIRRALDLLLGGIARS
jgi:AcrR family transcriptional regulator